MTLAEMTTLRDNARKEMADELQTIREAKEALKSLTEQVQVQVRSLSLITKIVVLIHPD